MIIRKIGIIGRTYHHVQRYRQILSVLFKYGFGDMVDILKVEQYLEIGLQMISRKRREKIESLSRAERVRMALEELGPTFVKLGQVLSTRPDILPVEFMQELEKLQDHVPSFDYAEAKRIIEAELGASLDEIFQTFDESPLASASLGQVHRARFANEDEVVIKVQRPDIRKNIEVDMEIMLHLATLMERHLEGWDVHRPSRIVEEFSRTLEKELDYTLEASHMERFAGQFAGDLTVYVPKVYREMTTSRVLTMEYIDGIKDNNIQLMKDRGLDPCEIARRGFDLIMKQIFVHGFFHADPHPGNIFILPDNVICYLDFGMMGRISRKSREDFVDMVAASANKDEVKAVDALLRLTEWEKEPDIASLQRDTAEFMDQYLYRPLKELEMGKMLQLLLKTASRHRIRIHPDLFLMMKALSTVEGVGRVLDPDFNSIERATPFIQQIKRNRLHPRRIAGDMADYSIEILQLLKEIPGEFREILKLARQGKLKMEFEHQGLEPILSSHDRISNRISFAIVLAAQIIGSSLIVLADIPPKWHEIPIVGLSGFLVAGVMGFWLLVSILRRGKM